MKKDKEWLKGEIHKEIKRINEPMEYSTYEHDIRTSMVDVFKELADQLDEPEIPKVTEPVAEWIEHWRTSNLTDIGVIGEAVRDCRTDVIEMARNRAGDLISAYQNGYEVEKEKRYRVIFPSGHLLYENTRNEKYPYSFAPTTFILTTVKYTFTEQEIKAIDERFWAFAEEVTEL